MSQRSHWHFLFSGKEVAEAAAKKATYHRERLEFWKLEADLAESKLREKGVEFRSYPVTGGEQLNVVLDTDLQKRLQECKSKVRDHETELRRYELWGVACARVHGELGLDCDDIEYFGL